MVASVNVRRTDNREGVHPVMADIDKVYELLLDQFSDCPNWQKYYTVFSDLTDELRQAAIEWHLHRTIETAEGPGLDVCGIKVGLKRPYEWIDSGVFTWDSSVVGERWDEGVWSDSSGLQTTELVDDSIYRPLLRAKAYANGAGGSLYCIAKTIDLMFSIDYSIQTADARVISITFNETVTPFQRFYIRALAPVQGDTDLVFTN